MGSCSSIAIEEHGWVKEGDPVPNVRLDTSCPTRCVDLADFCQNRRVVLIGCPIDQADPCGDVRVPGFVNRQDELRAKCVSAVIVFSVQDGSTMAKWARSLDAAATTALTALGQSMAASMVTFLGDAEAKLTTALGLRLEDPSGNGAAPRCKRCAVIIQGGVVWRMNVASYSDDPTGERHPHIADVDRVLAELDALPPPAHLESYEQRGWPLSPHRRGHSLEVMGTLPVKCSHRPRSGSRSSESTRPGSKNSVGSVVSGQSSVSDDSLSSRGTSPGSSVDQWVSHPFAERDDLPGSAAHVGDKMYYHAT